MLDRHVLVFDIETIADIASYRTIRHLTQDVADAEVLKIMESERLAETGNTFHRHHLYRVVALSLLLVQENGIKLWSLGRGEATEAQILTRFFEGIDKLNPTLVSWNGGGFDLPVLHYRALLHGISAPAYFEIGDNEQSARFNNYLGRFHWKHIDMMDVLSGYQARAVAPLNDIAKMCGLPGKLDTDGGQVQTLWNDGKREQICDYCETDVLNTYGVFLRFEHLRGRLSLADYQQRLNELRTYLQAKNQAHLNEFLQAWSRV